MTTQSTTRETTFEAAGGPWTNLSSTACQQMDTAFKAAEPALQAVARVQMAWAQLAISRARAWSAVPGDFSRCRGPADVATLQLNFWQEAQQAYAEGWQRILTASRGLAAPIAETPAATTRRDVLAVPESTSEERKRHAA